MRRCANAPMRRCADAPMRRCADAPMRRCADAPSKANHWNITQKTKNVLTDGGAMRYLGCMDSSTIRSALPLAYAMRLNCRFPQQKAMVSKIPSTYTGYIGAVTVRARYRYIVYGSVRGIVSQHRTASGAERSAAADRNACDRLPGGKSYSDVRVYVMDRAGVEGWRVIG